MVKLKSIPYITCDDVEQLTGAHWGDFEFAQLAEDGSYQILCCADWYLEELYEDFEYENAKEGDITAKDYDGDEEEYSWHRKHCRAVRLKNQIDLVEILRKQYGCRDTVLVYVSW